MRGDIVIGTLDPAGLIIIRQVLGYFTTTSFIAGNARVTGWAANAAQTVRACVVVARWFAVTQENNMSGLAGIGNRRFTLVAKIGCGVIQRWNYGSVVVRTSTGGSDFIYFRNQDLPVGFGCSTLIFYTELHGLARAVVPSDQGDSGACRANHCYHRAVG